MNFGYNNHAIATVAGHFHTGVLQDASWSGDLHLGHYLASAIDTDKIISDCKLKVMST
jgi:hypothetical protein